MALLAVRRHAAPRRRGSPVHRGPLPCQSAAERERESGCVREKGINVAMSSRTASTRCAAVEGHLSTEGYRRLHASCRRERERLIVIDEREREVEERII
jgi:transcription initiation factor TFIID subunit TAF12